MPHERIADGAGSLAITLRRTTPADLDFVLALEHRPDNRDYIGQWTREEHLASMARPDRQHLVIAAPDGDRLGYLITYDVVAAGYGIYIKRIAVVERARGIGRATLAALAARAWAGGAPLISLAVRPHNQRAQRCYRAVGFQMWWLEPSQSSDFLAKVDPCAPGCLVMRLRRAAAHTPKAPME